jgi:hypothetical protein
MISKTTLIELAKDSPLPTAASLTLIGVPVETWILWLTAGWAVFRIASAALDLYWKVKDRYEQKKAREHSGDERAARSSGKDSDSGGAGA